jgi:hypothetical protein
MSRFILALLGLANKKLTIPKIFQKRAVSSLIVHFQVIITPQNLFQNLSISLQPPTMNLGISNFQPLKNHVQK